MAPRPWRKLLDFRRKLQRATGVEDALVEPLAQIVRDMVKPEYGFPDWGFDEDEAIEFAARFVSVLRKP